MMNKFKQGEIVVINGIGKATGKRYSNVLGIIGKKDYDFVEYEVNILFDNSDWFREKDLKRVFEKSKKKTNKYKTCFAISKYGLDFILEEVEAKVKDNVNLFNKADIFQKYIVDNKEYFFIILSNTYWAENNLTVKIINEALPVLRSNNIAYQLISIGINEKQDIKINEFIKNDKNVDIFELSTNIKIKKIGGII